MAQNIRVTEEIKAKLLEEFAKQLDLYKGVDSKIRLEQDLQKIDNQRVKLIVSPKALYKMYALVFEYSSEIAWHGLVSRPRQDTFVIEDILVYPQIVASATVNTDQEAYSNWILALPEEQLNKLRFQGHSHVDMGVTPSSVDLTHQNSIVQALGNDDFYIFCIVNKRFQYNYWIYDMAANLKYDTKDIDLFYMDEQTEGEVYQMLDWCEKNVVKKTYGSPAKPEDKKPAAPKVSAPQTVIKTEKPAKKQKKKKETLVTICSRPMSASTERQETWGEYADRYFDGYPYYMDREDW